MEEDEEEEGAGRGECLTVRAGTYRDSDTWELPESGDLRLQGSLASNARPCECPPKHLHFCSFSSSCRSRTCSFRSSPFFVMFATCRSTSNGQPSLAFCYARMSRSALSPQWQADFPTHSRARAQIRPSAHPQLAKHYGCESYAKFRVPLGLRVSRYRCVAHEILGRNLRLGSSVCRRWEFVSLSARTRDRIALVVRNHQSRLSDERSNVQTSDDFPTGWVSPPPPAASRHTTLR